jgi:hypothetical protein
MEKRNLPAGNAKDTDGEVNLPADNANGAEKPGMPATYTSSAGMKSRYLFFVKFNR